MMYPFKSMSEIARIIIDLGNLIYPEEGKPEFTNSEWEDFVFACNVWKDRTGKYVTFKEYKIIKLVYSQ